MILKEYPAVKIFTGLIAGLALFSQFHINPLVIIILSSVCLITGILLIKRHKALSYLLFISVISLILSYNLNSVSFDHPDKIIPEQKAVVKGEVTKVLNRKSNYMRCIVKGSIDSETMEQIPNTAIILSVTQLNKRDIELSPGTKIFANVKARLPKKAILPTDFSEITYANSLNIQWIARCNSYNISTLGEPSGYYYFSDLLTKKVQQRCMDIFPERSQGIAIALITGDKSKIPYETKQSFSFAGTAHVLAVSGLHIGIIASIIYILLGFIQRPRLKFVIFSLALISFIILSGLQPSALRAGLMAIAILFVKTVQRKFNIVNVIFFVLTLIIVFSPSMIYSAGFQMSAFSILGIALLFKPVKSFFLIIHNSDNSIYQYFINSVSVSIAASAAVSPLVAYYFDVYSIVSPISNLFVIPLMSLGLIFSVIALAFSFIIGGIAEMYALSADFLFNLSEKINEFVIQLPYSYIHNETAVYISIIISLIMIYFIFAKDRKQLAFRCSACIVIVLLIINILPSEKKQMEIFPRDQYVAAIIPLSNNKQFVYISDRKPSQYPFRDIGMEKYLLGLKDTLIFGYTGNAGIALTDELNKTAHFESYELSLDAQLYLNRLLRPNDYLPQLIDL